MEKFITHQGIAAELPIVNVDTDMIIPKQFLKTIKRTGLGVHLFDEMRYDENGNEIADFVLNRAEYREASILIAGENFGCGSSREHAPWALLDFGIKAIIAPSFADIFYNNCFKNGILPIVLAQEIISKIDVSEGVKIDLKNQEISSVKSGASFDFEIDPFRKKCLLEGLDDISLTLQHEHKIGEFEEKRAVHLNWL